MYPRIASPDTKFDENGIYKADIAVEAAEAKELIARLQDIHKSHTGKAAPVSKNFMFEKETDEEGEETGRVVLKFRVKNRITKKGELWDRQPKVFDAKGNRLVDIPNIGGGSVLKVNFEVYEWNSGTKTGVSLQPLKIQLLELSEFNFDDSSPFEEEEGFTIDQSDDDESFDGNDGADDNDDF